MVRMSRLRCLSLLLPLLLVVRCCDINFVVATSSKSKCRGNGVPRKGLQQIFKNDDGEGRDIKKYIIETASHKPRNSTDVEEIVASGSLQHVLDKLDPYMVSLKTFHVPLRTQKKQTLKESRTRENAETEKEDGEYVSDVTLWRKWLIRSDKQGRRKSRRAWRNANSAFWAWKMLKLMEEEGSIKIQGSCHTKGWNNSAVCQPPGRKSQDGIGNAEIHVGFNLEPEDLVSDVSKVDKTESMKSSPDTGNLLMFIDLDVGLAKKLSVTEAVYAIEQDKEIHISDDCAAKEDCSTCSQTGSVPWHLDRIDQRDSKDDSYSWSTCDDGRDSIIYVADTGIRVSHNEFEDRAVLGLNALESDLESEDDDGHGTHVAGIIAGKDYGVAKRATVVAVKVFDSDGRGTISYLLKGLEWIKEDATDSVKSDSINRRKIRRSIVNLSLGSSKSESMNRQLEKLVNQGIISVVSAGNDDTDACDQSPASHFRSITVGASTSDDEKASFSNYGPCIDLFAPGTILWLHLMKVMRVS